MITIATYKFYGMKQIEIDPRAKALIFDIDGTLADTMPAHLLAFQQTLRPFDFEMTKAILDSYAGIPLLETMVMLNDKYQFRNFDPAKAAHQKEENYRKTISSTKRIEVVCNVLIDNYGKMPIGCGTGGDSISAELTLKAIDVIDLVSAVVTCDDVVNGKPAPDTFLKCAEMLGVEPQFCQVFEDAKLGLQAAKAAGMIVTDINNYL